MACYNVPIRRMTTEKGRALIQKIISTDEQFTLVSVLEIHVDTDSCIVLA